MGFKLNTPYNSIDGYLQKKNENLHRQHIEILKRMGEKAVTEARKNHRYENQTGNLQSSIGYCIVDSGKVVFGGAETFEVVKDGQKGAEEGCEYLSRLVSEHPSGLVLIVVAGMEYAAYVEAKNLNVLDSAELLVEHELSAILRQLKID